MSTCNFLIPIGFRLFSDKNEAYSWNDTYIHTAYTPIYSIHGQVHIYTPNWQLHDVITSFGFIKVVRFLRGVIEIQPLIDCWQLKKRMEQNTHTLTYTYICVNFTSIYFVAGINCMCSISNGILRLLYEPNEANEWIQQFEWGRVWMDQCMLYVYIESLQSTLVISLTGNRIRMNAIPTVQIGKFIGKVQIVIHFSYICECPQTIRITSHRAFNTFHLVLVCFICVLAGSSYSSISFSE